MYGCHPYKRHNPSFNFRVLHGFVRENSVLKYESFVLVLHLPPKFRTVEHACTWGVLTDCGGAPHQVCDTNLAAALLPNGSMVGVWRHCETVNLHTMPYSLLARGDTSPPAAGYVPSTSENFPFMAHAGAQLAPGVFWLSRFFFSFLFSKRRRSLWDLGLAGCQSHSAAKPSHRGARSPRSRPHEIRSVILSAGRSHNKQTVARGGGCPSQARRTPSSGMRKAPRQTTLRWCTPCCTTSRSHAAPTPPWAAGASACSACVVLLCRPHVVYPVPALSAWGAQISCQPRLACVKCVRCWA